jgi:CRP/FNR family cyclic AMP-dependent transcriptional regulator
MLEKKATLHHSLKLKKGDFLFKQNGASQEFYIIKSGTIKIYRTVGSSDIVLDTIGPGMFAGEIAPLVGGLRTANGVALSDVEVIVIPREEFKVIFEKIPEWLRKIALILVQRLREADEKISRAATIDHTKQVAALISLMTYSEKFLNVNGRFEIDQKFLEFEIMDLFAIPLAEIQDVLEQLAAKNLFQIQNGKIIIEKKDALDELGSEIISF